MTQTNAKSTATLEIDALSYGPYGIGRLDGKATMVPHTAPGDTVEVRITEEKERYDIGEAIRVLAPSRLRQAPPCPYVGACGGCSWQHLRYDAQLKAKQQSVVDALRRIGRLGDFELRPIIPSNDEFHYRRRIRLQVGGNRTLGFYGTASHQLVEIGSCLIANDRLNGALDSVRRWVRALATPLEYVEIVAGDEPEEIVVVARAIGPFAPNDEPACANLSGEGKQIRGLIVGGADWRRVWDKAAISVSLLADLSLSLDADVFTQVNAEGNRSILKALLAAGDFQSSDRVLELYCGGGNFTLPIAERTKEIVAVEGYKASIANGLKRKREQFTKIVLDPPRAGAKGLEADLAALRANQIFYISCNPTTLARDLAALTTHGYKLRMIQPIDLFPQTFHVEILAVIEQR